MFTYQANVLGTNEIYSGLYSPSEIMLILSSGSGTKVASSVLYAYSATLAAIWIDTLQISLNGG